LDPAALSRIRGLIPHDPRSAEDEGSQQKKADLLVLAARGYSGESIKDGMPMDRVLVHDFEMPVRIGLYENERAMAQRVRFNVDAEVARVTQPAQDLCDVLSYDVITDGIRLIAAEGHVPLVEMLAERVADFVLGHPQVQRVTVKVEKLQVGSGRVGVEITRQRAKSVAKIYQLFSSTAGNDGLTD